jgi:hypothetical protein
VFVAALALLAPLSATPAVAETTIDQAVVLDPYDPTPGIAFDHCSDGCHRHCRSSCGRRYRRHCGDDCYTERRHHCGRDCYAENRPRCDGDRCRDGYDADASTAGGPPPAAPKPCLSGNCFDAERYEHKWRDGTRKGHDWYRRGSSERDWEASDQNIDNGDDAPWSAPPPPPPPPPPAKK